MANWKATVELRDLHAQHEDGKLDIQNVALELARRLEALPSTQAHGVRDCELDDLIAELRQISQMSDDEFDQDPADEYDEVLERIYNWGDTRRHLWLA